MSFGAGTRWVRTYPEWGTRLPIETMRPLFAIAFAALQAKASMPRLDERAELYQWFDTLGYEALLTAPFVEVEDKNFGEDEPKKYVAFLLDSDKGRVRFCGPNLWKESLRPKVKYRVIDFRAWLGANQAKLVGQDRMGSDSYQANPLPRGNLELFVLSRVADYRGFKDLSNRLYAKASTSQRGRFTDVKWIPDEPFPKWLHETIASVAEDRINRNICDPNEPRSKTLKACLAYLDRFSDSDGAPWVQDTAGVLREMVKEERDHVVPNLKRATEKEMIAEWIYQLRKVSGAPFLTRGSFDVFSSLGFDPSGDNTAPKRLADLGFKSVPYLIDKLHDRSFTLAHSNAIQGSGFNFRVRDIVFQILKRISGTEFTNGTPESLTNEEARKAEQAVRSWWSKASKMGEAKALEKEIRSGLSYGSSLAIRLFKLSPDRAVPAIAARLRASKDGLRAQDLMYALHFIGTAEAWKTIRDQVQSGCTLLVRVQAATALFERDPEGAVDAMIRELSVIGGLAHEDGLDNFLLSSGRARAVRSVRNLIHRLPVDRRWSIVNSCLSGLPSDQMNSAGTRKPQPSEVKAYEREVEGLLASELLDTKVVNCAIGGDGLDMGFENPRICDLASCALSKIRPQKYRFVNSFLTSRLDYFRLSNLNTWRRDQGLLPIAVPSSKVVPVVPKAVLDPILTKAIHGSEVEKSRAMDQIRSLGLSALFGLNQRIGMLTAANPAKAQLTDLAIELSMTVTRVNYGEGATNNPRVRLPKVGERLSPTNLLRLFVRASADRTHASTLTVSRDRDLQGLEITFDCSTVKAASEPMMSVQEVATPDRYLRLETERDELVSPSLKGIITRYLQQPPTKPFRFTNRIEKS